MAARDKYQFQWWAVSMVDAMPFGGRKKGADGGVDGIIYFKPDGKRTEKAIVSVKGGDHVGVQMDPRPPLRDGARKGADRRVHHQGDADQRHAARGRRRRPLRGCLGRTYPRFQIVTLAELFQGRKPDIPYVDPGAAFKRAGREDTSRQEKLL